ncbi:GlsB/YeaQ/YmgE family stress response membrane protein [bacterium]|nr:GlsB/YeaQ/YmgE family stress response membrane protein [bacterium]|tara:strand:+ start:524 stop:775 length:252 start_codon:yes stop_codon:yes gene_type:complete
MGILAWIIVGGVAGWLASLFMKTDAQQGILMNIIVGIVGAFVGGFVFSLLGLGGMAGFSLYSLLVATVGAVILLAIYKAIARA